MEKILNLSKMLEIFLDDEEAIQEVLLMLEDAIPEFLENMHKYMAENDMRQFKFTIHKFKSSCQLITEPAFIDLIKTIEHADVDEINAIRPLINELEDLTRQLQKEVRVY